MVLFPENPTNLQKKDIKKKPRKIRGFFLCLQNTASKAVFRLVVQVRSDLFVVHVCGIIPVSICRNVFKFFSVCCCCQSVDCIVSHHQRRLCNCSEECSVLNCCFDDRTSVETNTDNIAVCCVRTKNVQVCVSCKNTFCCCLVGTEDSDAKLSYSKEKWTI